MRTPAGYRPQRSEVQREGGHELIKRSILVLREVLIPSSWSIVRQRDRAGSEPEYLGRLRELK